MSENAQNKLVRLTETRNILLCKLSRRNNYLMYVSSGRGTYTPHARQTATNRVVTEITHLGMQLAIVDREIAILRQKEK